MTSLRRLERLFRIGIAVAALMLVTAAILIFARERQFARLEDEYAAARQSATLLEQYVESGSIPELPPAVLGFGLYEASGRALAAAGSAPPAIEPPDNGDLLRRIGSQLRLVRPIGGPRGMPNPMPGARGPVPADRGLRRMPGFATQFVLLDYDLYHSGRQQAWERAALLASGLLMVAVLGIVVVLYRRLQIAHRQAEEQSRLAQLGEAARTLAHEIKNPLTAAQMQSALLRRSIESAQHGRVDILDEELGRIRMLTDQIREFLRNGAGNPEPIPARAAIDEIASRLSIQVDLSGDERAVVRFDRERFYSALGNVLRNAQEASAEHQRIEATVTSHRSRVEIAIADRGSGIPAEERDRVFDPFYTTKTQGSGVGLAITRRFVEEAGGKITIHEREGGGTVVSMSIPGSSA